MAEFWHPFKFHMTWVRWKIYLGLLLLHLYLDRKLAHAWHKPDRRDSARHQTLFLKLW